MLCHGLFQTFDFGVNGHVADCEVFFELEYSPSSSVFSVLQINCPFDDLGLCRSSVYVNRISCILSCSVCDHDLEFCFGR